MGVGSGRQGDMGMFACLPFCFEHGSDLLLHVWSVPET